MNENCQYVCSIRVRSIGCSGAGRRVSGPPAAAPLGGDNLAPAFVPPLTPERQHVSRTGKHDIRVVRAVE